MTRRILTDKKISHEFMSVLTGGGGPSIECSICGRTHFATHSPYYEEGEYERYLTHEKEDPDGYISSDAECVHYVELDGNVYPDDCPCNGLTRYENFMWNQRGLWSSYLMAKKLALQAEIDSIGTIP